VATNSNQPAEKKKSSGYSILWVFVPILLFLWTVQAAMPLLSLKWSVFQTRDETEASRVQVVLQELGTYGDMFGPFNALVSVITSAGVVYTLYLQQKQIAHQQKELEESTEAQRRTEEAMLEQARIARQAALLNATGLLFQTYAQLYASNPDREGSDWEVARQRDLREPGNAYEEKTTIARMQFYQETLRRLHKEMLNESDVQAHHEGETPTTNDAPPLALKGD
jgi:flagellar basal body-associated protein FliL